MLAAGVGWGVLARKDSFDQESAGLLRALLNPTK